MKDLANISERLPNAWALAAQYCKVDPSTLRDLIEGEQITEDTLLPRLRALLEQETTLKPERNHDA
jgi:hypothetical protein